MITALLFFHLLVGVSFAQSETEASVALAKAEEDLTLAHVKTVEAEDAGANVSKLLLDLAFAGDLLSGAHSLFRTQDYLGAHSLAENCSQVAGDITDEAAVLGSEAQGVSDRVFLTTAGACGVGLIVFLVLAWVGWRYLKRTYLTHTLKLKPEVVDPDES